MEVVPSFDLILWGISLLTLLAAAMVRSSTHTAALLMVFSTGLLVLRSMPDEEVRIPNSQKEVRILTLNVGQLSNDTSVAQSAAQLIKDLDVDMVFLQEFGVYYKWPDVVSVAKDFAQQTAMPYHDFTPHTGNIFGTACFSKFPIVKVDTLFQLLSETNEAKKYELQIGKDTLYVVNVHAQSYNLFNPRGPTPGMMQLEDAVMRRLEQLTNVSRSGADVIVGDFNASPGSQAYAVMQEHFRDVQRDAGLGLIPTHAWLPARLDYIWVRNGIGWKDVSVESSFSSDHHAIIATITW